MNTLKNTLKNNLLIPIALGAALTTFGHNAFAGAVDDPLLFKLNIDKFEKRNKDSDSYVFESQAWLGYDLNKLKIKTKAERVNGSTENAEIELLYSKAILPFWDLQIGLRHNAEPKPERNWAVIGFQGVSPYYFDIDAALYIGESGRSEFSFEAEYEQMITQRLVLIPEVEFTFSGKTDEATATGSGLVSSEISLRLAYEVKREFSPYIGVTWEAKHGKTKRMAAQEGESTSETKLVAGFQAWF
jgi:copper resistance protein B